MDIEAKGCSPFRFSTRDRTVVFTTKEGILGFNNHSGWQLTFDRYVNVAAENGFPGPGQDGHLLTFFLFLLLRVEEMGTDLLSLSPSKKATHFRCCRAEHTHSKVGKAKPHSSCLASIFVDACKLLCRS